MHALHLLRKNQTSDLMNIKETAFLIAGLIGLANCSAQSDCNGERYRYTSAFENFSLSYDVPYGENINALGQDETLVADMYLPVGDTETARPLIIMAHGGLFVAGSNDGLDVVPLCEDLARMGYVVASISYRLGVYDLLNMEKAFTEAVLRGVHDGRAAVRFFRKSVEEGGNPWGIDPERIVMGGVSAGAFIALHHAYVDEEDEIPEIIDQDAAGLGGGLEGESGNPGYSSEVYGVFSIAGALGSASFLAPGDEPVILLHSTGDPLVPYGEGEIELLGITVTSVEGSSTIAEASEEAEVDVCFVSSESNSHVPHVTDPVAYDLALSTIAGGVSTWLCDDYEPLCGAYDTSSSLEELMSFSSPDQPRIFPNPALAGSTVTLDSEGSWWLMDGLGRVISNGKGNALETSALVPGLYVVGQVGADSRPTRLPLIIQ
jgi:para-nitrobenzyl esterase